MTLSSPRPSWWSRGAIAVLSVIVTVTEDVNVPPVGLTTGVATACCWMT